MSFLTGIPVTKAQVPVDNLFEVLRWIGHSLSLAAIGAAILGIIPVVAVLMPMIYYSIVVYESKTVQAFIKSRRLKKLLHMRARAVALELIIKGSDIDLAALDAANQVHLAAVSRATEIAHEEMKAEQRVVEGKRIEAEIFGLKKNSDSNLPKDG